MSWCLRLIVVFEFDPIFQSWLMVDVHGGSSIWRFYFYFYFRILVWCFDFSQCPFQNVRIHVCQALLASCCFICRFASFVWLNTKGEPESRANGKGNQIVSQPLLAHRKDGYKYTGVMGVTKEEETGFRMISSEEREDLKSKQRPTIKVLSILPKEQAGIEPPTSWLVGDLLS